ncbi:Adenine nucleotide alpha hydrolases-like superfamily protein [Prunus dulcis]|uniref:Adenine nucleotide alpha hydrolases-like superfamily protein n=1 Tax=Prunus dulcis TaxID=3755 RepID=A0A4Y1RPZ2_PRUDU|nr:Adenine nucleotide alpha hydrolases-like superfamily protein [Prunus dulcis]
MLRSSFGGASPMGPRGVGPASRGHTQPRGEVPVRRAPVYGVNNEIVYDASQVLMQKLAIEAFEVAMVRTIARIVQGDPGKCTTGKCQRVLHAQLSWRRVIDLASGTHGFTVSDP